MARVSILSKDHQKNNIIEAQRPTLSKRELESVLDCLIADQLSQGQITRRFEKSFSNTFGYKNALAVNSLMAGYHIAFLGLEIGSEDHIILSPLTSIAVADAALLVKAKIHLVDIAANSYHPEKKAIFDLVKSIRDNEKEKSSKIVYIADHVFGSVLNFDLEDILLENIIVIEDFTGLVGSTYKDDYFGKKGTLSICGLAEYDLITTGNGSMLLTSDSLLFKKLNQLRYGAERIPHNLALDYRLGDFQTAMGLVQLSNLGLTLTRRKKVAQFYLETLRNTKHECYFTKPEIDNYLKFPILIQKEFDEVQRYFKSLHIEISKVSELPIHHFLGLPPLQFPNAERLFRRSICVPIYPGLSTNQIERITKALRSMY